MPSGQCLIEDSEDSIEDVEEDVKIEDLNPSVTSAESVMLLGNLLQFISRTTLELVPSLTAEIGRIFSLHYEQ